MKSKTYEEFVEKFKSKKTTDDCYTPPSIYAVVRDWACKEYGIDPSEIVRPFYPGGDYKRFNYPEGAVVLHAPVEDALAVYALDVPHRIPARQHRACGETARRVAPCKLPAAVGTLLLPCFQLLHTIWTNASLLHVGPSP